MSRRAGIWLAGLLALATGAGAGEYAHDHPTLAVIRAADAATLQRFVARTPLGLALDLPETLEAWRELPVVGAADPGRLAQALRRAQARDLTLILLPPLSSPPRGVFLFRSPLLATPEELAGFIKSAGFPARQAAAVLADGRLLLAGDRKTLARFVAADGGRDEAWRASLAEVLRRDEPGLAAWFDAEWLCGLAAAKSCDVRERLLLAGLTPPTAAVLRWEELSERDQRLRLRLTGLAATGPQEASVRLPPPEPGEAGLVLDLPEAAERTLWWPLILDLASLVDPEADEFLTYQSDLLRLLTGLHPQTDLLCGLERRLTATLRHEPGGRSHWRIATRTRPDRPELRANLDRALGWTQFFLSRFAPDWRLETEANDRRLAARLYRGQELTAGLTLEAGKLVLTDGAEADPEAAAIEEPPAAEPTPGREWLRWRLAWPGASAERAGSSATFLAGFVAGNPLGILAALADADEGRLYSTPAGLELELTGRQPALAETLVGAWLNERLAGWGDGLTADARGAAAFLLIFQEAQGIYRLLDLGPLNGGEAGAAPSLAALVNGVAQSARPGEAGAPLADFFNRRYAQREGYPDLAQIARAVSDGRTLFNYQIVAPRSRGGQPFDPRRETALLAWPRQTSTGPGLALYPDGRLYALPAERCGDKPPADLPAEPLAAGWWAVR